MCLAIPMQVKQVNRFSVICEARGIEREAGLLTMLDHDLRVGDYVMISMGQVTARVSAEEAASAWALYDEIFDEIDSK
jgi:hydrogenase expression/formation protein HypC